MTRMFVGTRTILAKTCHDCGELKSADAFGRNHEGRYLNTVCGTCINARTATNNANTLERASNHRQPWTEHEDDQLLLLRVNGKTHKEVALILGRTILSTTARYRKLINGGVTYEA